MLVAQLELANDKGASILTERDARALEATTDDRFSVEAASARYGLERRWSDDIVGTAERRTAVKIEFADKGTTRLKSILDGYHGSTTFGEVRFLVRDAPLRKRIEEHAHHETAPASSLFAASQPAIVVVSTQLA